MDSHLSDWSEESNFTYVRSCQLHMNMRIKINYIDNQRPPPTSLEILENPVLEFSPWANRMKRADLLIKCQVSIIKCSFIHVLSITNILFVKF